MDCNRTESTPGNRLSFLGAVARACVDRYADLSDFCFVFPNKRAGTFFLKNLSECIGPRVLLAPETLGVAEFMQRVTGLEVVSRIDLVFRLYKAYRSLSGKPASLRSDDDLLDFDRFAPWAETLAGDFSEVERFDADADALFKNVRDYRSIASNFLTEEQCDIIERYFGYRPAPANVESFWKSVGDEEDRTVLKRKFIELWKLLPELYDSILRDLSADGLALQGTTFREAMRLVEERGRDALPWSHVVVVGFNMLSTTEAKLFSGLRDMKADDGTPYADFFWDAAGPVLDPDYGAHASPAAAAMRRNIANFPMPDWAAPFMRMADVSGMPDSLTIAASPSNAAQVKVAAIKVEEWLREVGDEKIADARAAVVLPDENLLLPLIHSLPGGLRSINLTMGYSMRYTAVASFIYHLRRLMGRLRKADGKPGYYHEDFRLFMSHPLVHAVVGTDTANRINGDVANLHLRIVTLDWLRERSAPAARMLEPLQRDSTPQQTVARISEVLDMVDEALERSAPAAAPVNSKIERMQISLYQQALSRLLLAVTTHGVTMRFQSVFYLADKLLAGETVTFEGEPLEGLQVMGLLETRALDFDHLLILSMNDKVMPRRSRQRTFIPDALRRGYGLPPSGQGEELYAYYFYRLISRARDVTLVYDSRAGEGMRSGGKSRFLIQLELLHARGHVREKSFTYGLELSYPNPQTVVKTDAVMARLDEFRHEENGRNLSASALMNYCQCPVKFYYLNVVGVKDDVEAKKHIDPITQGNIVHDAMLSLYLPAPLRGKYLRDHVVLGKERLREILDDPDRIPAAVRRAVNRLHYHLKDEELSRPLKGTIAMSAEMIERQVRNAVRHDLLNAPVELAGGEISGRIRWKVGEAPEVNFRYAFDRVDISQDRLRIVDYKTGEPRVQAAEFEDVFSGKHESKYMFQLMLYAHLLERKVPDADKAAADDIGLAIFDVNRKPGEVECVPSVGGKPVTGHRAISEQFLTGLENMLLDIYDRQKPFEPVQDDATCRYCRLKTLCGKE